MQVTTDRQSPTKLKLTISANSAELAELKQPLVKRLAKDLKIPGFRPGKAPLNVAEKNLDNNLLQSEFLNEAVNQLFELAVKQKRLRLTDEPMVSITKFVPFSDLEFSAEVEVLGEVKLASYTELKLEPTTVTVSAKELNDVLENLRERASDAKPVDRAAKTGDQVTLDFSGSDPKTKEPIAGADGQDYPLVLGSHNFIPGFEEALVGLKGGQSKSFDITFPADYSAAPLRGRLVTFKVTIKKVEDLTKPPLDDKLAAKLGPFNNLDELKADIKKQLTAEKQREANQALDNSLLEQIADKTSVVIPDHLIDQEINRIEEEEKRNLVYRGQTWPEHLKEEGLTEDEHRSRQRPIAEKRIKSGIVLGEIAEREKVEVRPEELEVRLKLIKNQYQNDVAMQAELDKPENRRDLLNRLVIEKTLDRIRQLNKT